MMKINCVFLFFFVESSNPSFKKSLGIFLLLFFVEQELLLTGSIKKKDKWGFPMSFLVFGPLMSTPLFDF
ncbi:hypothetical protein YC2023_006330 [Brassica napus]